MMRRRVTLPKPRHDDSKSGYDQVVRWIGEARDRVKAHKDWGLYSKEF
jgi:hypothetical protein